MAAGVLQHTCVVRRCCGGRGAFRFCRVIFSRDAMRFSSSDSRLSLSASGPDDSLGRACAATPPRLNRSGQLLAEPAPITISVLRRKQITSYRCLNAFLRQVHGFDARYVT